MGLRMFGWAAVGIVLGFLLASMRAEQERAALVARVEELEKRLRSSARPSVFEAFLPRLTQQGAARPGASARARPEAPAGSSASAEPADTDEPEAERPRRVDDGVVIIGEASGGAAPATSAASGRAGLEPTPDELGHPGESDGPEQAGRTEEGSLAERFDQFASVQQARAAASRAALIQQAGLNEAQIAQVDATLKRMNDQLAGYAEEVVDQATRDDSPTPAQALGLGHDISGILFEGQKELDTIVGDAAADVEPEALEAWNYVDVEQWRPFVQQRLSGNKGTSAAGNGRGGRAGEPATKGDP